MLLQVRYDRPESSEYGPHYRGYITGVPDGPLLEILEAQIGESTELLGGLPEARGNFTYAPGKWSLKAVVGHVCDAERVFAYRALRFARGDATPLPSFDEQAWMQDSPFGQRTLADLVAEFHAVRRASLALFEHLPQEITTRRGIASGLEMSVRALAYTTAGHAHHHFQVIRERYL